MRGACDECCDWRGPKVIEPLALHPRFAWASARSGGQGAHTPSASMLAGSRACEGRRRVRFGRWPSHGATRNPNKACARARRLREHGEDGACPERARWHASSVKGEAPSANSPKRRSAQRIDIAPSFQRTFPSARRRVCTRRWISRTNSGSSSSRIFRLRNGARVAGGDRDETRAMYFMASSGCSARVHHGRSYLLAIRRTKRAIGDSRNGSRSIR